MIPDTEVLIVGAGVSGIGTGIELRRRGFDSFIILDAAHALGGTWRDNTYPGVAVDIPSSSYCYPFERSYPWSRVYAPGAEILQYLQQCAARYDIAAHIRYAARVLSASFSEATKTWHTRVANGTVITSRYLIAATGLFGTPIVPSIPGLDTFAGKVMHTARWDHDYDLAGKRVAVIGTGASAVQVVPAIAEHVAQLVVFQRTPIWVSPRIDAPLPRVASEALLEFLTFAIVNFRRVPFIVRTVQFFVERWMRSQVTDPAIAAQLVPSYGLGCKRPTVSNTYLQAFNHANTGLVTSAIARIGPTAIVTADATTHAVDAIVLATGFLTTEHGHNPSFEVVGRDARSLAQYWETEGRQAYAGVTVPGFPNFFLTAGPYSGGFNWFTMLEANLAHIVGCLHTARARGTPRVEVTPEAHARYMEHTHRRAEGTVFTAPVCAGSNSYYLDRHGDASLALPHTPGWRARRGRRFQTEGYGA